MTTPRDLAMHGHMIQPHHVHTIWLDDSTLPSQLSRVTVDLLDDSYEASVDWQLDARSHHLAELASAIVMRKRRAATVFVPLADHFHFTNALRLDLWGDNLEGGAA